MHTGRLFALAGVIIGVIGLFFQALRTDGAGLLPALSQASPDFPDGIPTIWGGLDTWAQVLLVVLMLGVVFMALVGARASAMDKTSSLTTAVIGVALLAYAIIKMVDAGDDAEALEGAFGQAASAGLIEQGFTVTTNIGFFVLILGTVLVIAGGLSGLRNTD